MDFFPGGLLLVLFSLTVGLLLWQRIAHCSFGAMGLTRIPPPPPHEVRAQVIRFFVVAGGVWFIGFAGGAIAFAFSSWPPPAGGYVLAGAAAVPVLVAPGAWKAIRRFGLRPGEGRP